RQHPSPGLIAQLLDDVAQEPVLLGLERAGRRHAHDAIVHERRLHQEPRTRSPTSHSLPRAAYRSASKVMNSAATVAAKPNPSRRVRCQRSPPVTIRGMETSTGAVVSARRSSTVWKEVSSFSRSIMAPTARPAAATRP